MFVSFIKHELLRSLSPRPYGDVTLVTVMFILFFIGRPCRFTEFTVSSSCLVSLVFRLTVMIRN